MAQGDGSIVERKKGVYEVQLSLGRDPATGKYRKVSRTVHGTKRDANAVLKELRKQRDGGIRLESGKMTFSELAALWLDAKRSAGTCSDSKLKLYKTRLGYVGRHIGNVRVTQVDARMVEQALTAIRDERNLSGTTAANVLMLVKSVFEKAIDYEIINRNPCRGITPPRKNEVNRRSLNDVEVAKLSARVDTAYSEELALVEGKESRQIERGNAFGRSAVRGVFNLSCIVAVRVALATGMRRGEVFGLTWGCVDLTRGAVSVRRSLTADGELKQPKTAAGMRTLAVDAKTAAFLASWKASQEKYLARLGMGQDGSTPVCCGDTGGFVQLVHFGRFWRKFRDAAGFPSLRFHELRHTQATQILAHGGDLKMVQARLGHSSAALTLGTYAHAVPENDGKAAEIIGALMGAETTSETPVVSMKTA